MKKAALIAQGGLLVWAARPELVGYLVDQTEKSCKLV